MFSTIRAYSTKALKGNKSIFKSAAFKPPAEPSSIPKKVKYYSRMNPATSSDSLAKLTISGQAGTSATPGSNSKQEKEKKDKGKAKVQQSSGGKQQAPNYKPNPSRSSKLRGFDKDPPEVRISKTLSWLLRHGAQGEGLPMRKDGYVKIIDLIEHPKLKAQDVDLERIKAMVTADSKQRYDLILESPQGVKLVVWGAESSSTPTIGESAADGSTSQKGELTVGASATSTLPEPIAIKDGIWWIKARQGHSIKTVELELKPVNSVSDIPTGTAVHGTNRVAWEIISKAGLSKMKRNHIHLAQNVAGQNVVSGMRTSSQVLIFIDIQKALDAGFKFWLSDNGVVLTEGDSRGYLPKKFFSRVVDVKLGELKGWEGSQ